MNAANRNRNLLVTSCTCLWLAIAGAAAAADIQVQVTDRSSGTPLTGASVCLGTSADPAQFGARRTAARGEARFTDIPDAPVILTVSAKGFKGVRQGFTAGRFDRVVDVSLPPGGLGPACEAPASESAAAQGGGLLVRTLGVNGGKASTRSRTVTLEPRVTGSPDEYRASESPVFKDAQWQPYSRTPSFELSPGAGTKTIYFQVRKVREAQGATLESLSNTVSARIAYRP